ncbi:non-specific lipid-transfer protein 2-like [Cynara cardunculus var. scolymus]|uniref:Bifunctional inhibitor/plant lipid transfer protein/seed storage helical domain-containing protein n=1 Tax=Cynara cardunculus var. scolymus TaxID=59895 RepID=A0A103XCE5_CYNCS|nr:non-specific lipid-transfer protein 2-like [Cynara cardunculus var. scolymus]KVH88142.1 Bifunctional inhibitor/plant lipid transfer protein/seed storage helical domain-containing protein [Cynara cardunculus var. scolymus]
MKMVKLVVCIVLVVLGIGARCSTVAATDCNPIQLSPCATAILSSTTPSETCCGKIKEQRSCLCNYINNPRLQKFINTPNARKVAATCGTPFPIC